MYARWTSLFFFLYKFSFGMFTYTAIYIYIYFQQQLVISSNTSNRDHYQYNRVDIFLVSHCEFYIFEMTCYISICQNLSDFELRQILVNFCSGNPSAS